MRSEPGLESQGTVSRWQDGGFQNSQGGQSLKAERPNQEEQTDPQLTPQESTEKVELNRTKGQ